MPKIITLAHQKGGVGKSTLALLLAYAFNENLKVGLLDCDLQGSLTNLNLMADGLNLIPYEGGSSFDFVKDLDYDLIIIDTPPYLSQNLHEIFLLSDFVLVPTKTGFFDMMAIQGTMALLNKAMAEKTGLKAGVVFNMVKHNSSLISEVKSLTSSFSIPVLNTYICDRVSYTRCIISGGILKSNDKNAIKEILNLCEEILSFLEV